MASEVQSLASEIRFFHPDKDDKIDYTFSIIVSQYHDQWIWVRHKERDTWELPAGHLEPGETPLEAAHRELYEETGALVYEIRPIISYEGRLSEKNVYGRIFLAVVTKLGQLPDFEISEIALFNKIPDNLTYPEIQPMFFNFVTNQPTGKASERAS